MQIVISFAIILSLLLSFLPNFGFAQSPVCTSPFTTKPMITGGYAHTVALNYDGTVWAWGYNTSGQLGNGSYNNSSSPVKVPALCNVVAIAAGGNHTVALKSDGTVWAWGSNEHGQLGYVTDAYFSSVAVQVPNLSNISAISAGNSHTVALKTDGTVWAWGRNDYGQLGDGTTTAGRSPVQVKDLSDVVSVAVGGNYTVVLKRDGTVWTWGWNADGQLGYETVLNNHNDTPKQVPNVSEVKLIAAGSSHTVVLKRDGTVWTWGWNYSGQLGNGTTTSSHDPEQVLNSLNPNQVLNGVASIAAGRMHTIALLNDGTLRSWGLNSSGQLGDDTYRDRLFAAQSGLNGVLVSVGAGYDHTVAIKDDGTVWTWGTNSYGQLGYKTDPLTSSKVPSPVDGFNVTTTHPTLQLGGRERLSYPEWSTAPTKLNAYLFNPGSDLTNVTLKLLLGSGLSLVDDDAVHTFDKITSGTIAETTWKVKPTAQGIHQLTVNAYREGELEPFATAAYQIEALGPVVPPSVTLRGLNGNQTNGTPVAARSANLTFNVSLDIPCQDVVFIATDASGRKHTGHMSPIPGAAWSYVFNPSSSGLTTSPLNIEINPQCGPGMQFGIVLIDPSGIVYNAERGDENAWPLPDATVVLQYNDPALGKWVDMSEEDYPGRLDPITNPQITGEDGRYAWDTAAGQYRVIVSRPGFQTAASRVVDVPPPVTDLHVGLTPTDRVPPSLTVTGVTYGATYTQPVAIPFRASDDEAGVRYVSYRLDQGEVQRASGTNGTVTVTAPGSHTVDFIVVDHAGNELAKQITFTIDGQPAGNTHYIVAFNSNGGSPVSNQTVSKGSAVIQPGDPTKTGYSFAGWYVDSGLTSAFDFATAIAGDTILYAKWMRSGNADLSALTVSDGMLSPAFAPGTTSYSASVANGVSSVTVTATVSDAVYATVTASVYNNVGTLVSGPLTLTSGAASPPLPLSVGSNTIKVIVAAREGTTKTYNVTATRATQSSSGVTDSSGSSDSLNGPVSLGGMSSSTTRFRILVNGKEFEQIAVFAISNEGGRTVFSVTVDAAQLADQLAKAGNKPEIFIPVTASADKVTLVMTGDAVKSMENKQAVLIIQTPNGNYKLPAAEIFIDRLSKQLGQQVKLSDVVVHVDIAKSDSDKAKLLGNSAARGHFTVIVPPVDFTVTASFNARMVTSDKFDSYVEREIPLPDGVDPNKITTAIVLEADGTTRSVPTSMTARNGKYYAVVHSLTNSTYALIWHSVTFSDVERHWAKLAVNDMASRMVVNGVDESRFQPDAAITRAEFAAIVVRALGLADNGKTAAFTDVKSDEWYVGAVAKAQEYGIIEGYADQMFRPTKTITRQEAMAMIVRAGKLAGLDTTLSAAESDAVLSKYSDGGAVQDWARQAVAVAVSNGLVSGSDAGLLPISDITRAETAAIVQRLLEKAKLIVGNL